MAPDLPGHGRSLGLTPQVYTIEGAARMLRELLDGLEISRAALAGYSMCGRLALYLALRHPERCSGLFLESASPGIDDAAERRARREADEERARRLESGDFGGFLADWYRQPLFASLARHEGLVEKINEARRRNDPAELARSLRGMGAGSWTRSTSGSHSGWPRRARTCAPSPFPGRDTTCVPRFPTPISPCCGASWVPRSAGWAEILTSCAG